MLENSIGSPSFPGTLFNGKDFKTFLHSSMLIKLSPRLEESLESVGIGKSSKVIVRFIYFYIITKSMRAL